MEWEICKIGCPISEREQGTCKSVSGDKCIFPFTYKGTSYNTCTNTESANGLVWCATEVRGENSVAYNWDDCSSDCFVERDGQRDGVREVGSKGDFCQGSQIDTIIKSKSGDNYIFKGDKYLNLNQAESSQRKIRSKGAGLR